MLISQVSDDETLNIAADTIKIGKQAIIFASSKASCEKTAHEIANYLKKHDINGKKTEISKEHEELSQKILNVLSHPTSQCEKLSESVKCGIAFHHSGLAYQQRDLIENAFREGKIKIIVATPTLAAGVSLPAFRTILKDLKRFSGYGMNYIPVLEYMQQSGRAGRPEYDTFGEAIMIAKTDKEKETLYDKYICGAPEEITSKLAVEPILRTYVLSLIATNFVKEKTELLDFFKDTFWAHQFGDFYYLTQKINSVLNDLIEYGFVEVVNEEDTTNKSGEHLKEKKKSHEDMFASASTLLKKQNKKESTKQLRATIIGTRVSELYIDPDSANQIIVSLNKAKADDKKKTSDFAYLFMLCQTTELKPRSNLSNKDFELMQEELLKKDDGEDDGGFITNKILPDEDLFYDYLNAFKSAFIIDLWTNEFGEDFLFEQYKVRPGELNEKLSRLDWLIYGASELAKLSGKKELITPLNRLRIRVQYGVKEELLPLLQIKGIGRARARKLFSNKLHNIGDLKKADESVLAHILGAKTAQNIKKQLGQDVLELTKEVRKDTNNLNSFF